MGNAAGNGGTDSSASSDGGSAAWSKYEAAKSVAWKEYEAAKSASWKKYEAAKNSAFKVYDDFDHAELMKLRTTNREAYLQWIDREKIRSTTQWLKPETSVPEIRAYVAASRAKFSEYEMSDRKAFNEYDKTTADAFKAYDVTREKAYQAYQTASQAKN